MPSYKVYHPSFVVDSLSPSCTDALDKHLANLIYSIDLYVNEGIRPGDFLMSVLSNNLWGVMARADENSLYLLRSIYNYIYNDVRGDCWGSPEKVQVWLTRHEFMKENSISYKGV